jgi:hypothetical protein
MTAAGGAPPRASEPAAGGVVAGVSVPPADPLHAVNAAMANSATAVDAQVFVAIAAVPPSIRRVRSVAWLRDATDPGDGEASVVCVVAGR